MNRTFSLAAIVAAGILASTTAGAQTTQADGLLRDAAGKTLYVFDKDGAGESRCYGGCANAWPPFLAADAAQPSGRLTLLNREGGGRQWALDGRPLYYFAGDAQAGDTRGDGSGGVWHVIQADAVASAQPAKAQSGYDYKY